VVDNRGFSIDLLDKIFSLEEENKKLKI